MGENMDFQEIDALYNNNSGLLSSACSVDTIDPALILSNTASSPSSSEIQSFSHMSSDSVSTLSMPHMKDIDHGSPQKTMSMMQEGNIYKNQHSPTHPQSYLGTLGQETTQEGSIYSRLSTPTTVSPLLDESIDIASMSSMDVSEDPIQHTLAHENSTMKQMGQASAAELQKLLDEPMINLCKSHQASTNISEFGSSSPNDYSKISVSKTNQPRGRLYLMNKRRPLLPRHPVYMNRARSPYSACVGPERELGVWRSQPYPPLESRPGSRAGAQSRQRREAPTSVPDFITNSPVVLSEKNEDWKRDGKIDIIEETHTTANPTGYLYSEPVTRQSASKLSSPSSPSSSCSSPFSPFTLIPAPQSPSHFVPSPSLSPFSLPPAIQHHLPLQSSHLSSPNRDLSPLHMTDSPQDLTTVTAEKENSVSASVSARSSNNDDLNINTVHAPDSRLLLDNLLRHVKRIGVECDALKILLKAVVSNGDDDDDGVGCGCGVRKEKGEEEEEEEEGK